MKYNRDHSNDNLNYDENVHLDRENFRHDSAKHEIGNLPPYQEEDYGPSMASLRKALGEEDQNRLDSRSSFNDHDGYDDYGDYDSRSRNGGYRGGGNRNGRNRRRKKKSNIIFIIVLVVAACVFVFAAYKLISIGTGYKKASDTYQEIAEKFQPQTTKETRTTKKGETTKQTETTTEAPFVWDYDYLLAVNPESAGWIRNGFLNYPIVHSTDDNGNEKYLYNLIDGEYNTCGTLFVDKNMPDGLYGMYSIVYGHNMQDASMFGKLQRYNDYYFYEENPEMDIYVGYDHYVYKVFAAFTASVDSFVYTYSLDNEEDFNNFVANARSMNTYEMYPGEITYGVNNIVTLSTCTNNNDPNYRYVVILCRDRMVG